MRIDAKYDRKQIVQIEIRMIKQNIFHLLVYDKYYFQERKKVHLHSNTQRKYNSRFTKRKKKGKIKREKGKIDIKKFCRN